MTVLSRKIDRPKKTVVRNIQVNILLTEDEAKLLDSVALKKQEENPGLRFSRGALVRDIVLKYLNGKLMIVEKGENIKFLSKDDLDV